jgi:Tol biopolymer transport system component
MKVRGKVLSFVAVAVVAAGLAPVAGGVSPAAAAALPTISVGDLQVVETDIGNTDVAIPVTLDQPAPAAVTVKIKVIAGSATKKRDYIGANANATVPKGATSTAAYVTLYGDTAVEGNETISFEATKAKNGTIADGAGQLTLVDNDANGVSATPEIRTGIPTIWEGNSGARTLQVPLTLSRPAPAAIALGFLDSCRPQIKVVPAGATGTTVNVTTFGDNVDTANRLVKNALALFSGPGTVLTPSGQTVVLDDDNPRGPLGVGGIARVSVDANGAQTVSPTVPDTDPRYLFPMHEMGTVSADGRYVAFRSNAPLVDCDTNMTDDIFVRDMTTGALERVSVGTGGIQGNEWAGNPHISADGRYVLFDSFASNLVPNDVNGWYDAFIYDRIAKTTRKVLDITAWHDGAYRASISADNRYIAFASRSRLAGDVDACIPADTPDVNGECDYDDAFVLDQTTGTITRASNSQGGWPGIVVGPSISADGSTVGYFSGYDAWVADRATGVTEQVDIAPAGAQMGNANASRPLSLSADGRKIAFLAQACATPCSNGLSQPFLRDRDTGVTTALNAGLTATPFSGWSSAPPAISRNGRYVTFSHTPPVATPGCPVTGSDRLYQRDLVTGAVSVVALTTTGTCDDGYPRLHSASPTSSDGSYVVYNSGAGNLVAGDTNGLDDIFIRRIR